MPALVTHFPINDGGMFYDMARDLRANHYLLPEATSYTGLDLPFAYPPLGLYLVSLLADVTRIPLLNLFLWLPPLLATLAIPAFYLLARVLLADNLRASLATSFYALTPGQYDWHIMGGGVTRALGMLFFLLASFYVVRLFRSLEASDSAHVWRTAKFPDFGLAILFCSLAVLSHPEVGLHTAGWCAVLWLFLGRSWRGTLRAIIVVLGVFLLTAPWWGTVIAQHGFAPFLSAIQTGQHASADWRALPINIFASDEFIPVLVILRAAGFVYAVWRKQFLLIVLTFLPILIDPRSADSISFLLMSILSALGFLDALPALIQKLRGVEISPVLNRRAGAVAVFTVIFVLFLECGLHNYALINSTLAAGERETMRWVRENIPSDQSFLLITGRSYSMSDPAQEWFPTLSGQHSQTTLQGLEWTLGVNFMSRFNDLVALQSCADLACVDAWSARTGLTYGYLWIAKTSDDLVKDMRASVEYRLVYESDSASIFARVEK